MIRVQTAWYEGNERLISETLVDADSAHVLESNSMGGSVLVLTKGARMTEVAWFENWDSAVKIDNLRETDD